MSRDYYNEHDPFAAAWLRALIAVGELPDGDVDERSIEDVVPTDLVGYRHCHFFAGIGGWPLAMRLADWPDDVSLWTGSCPCQPFSAAGQGSGFADERHLWPAWFWLIQQCRPRYVCGEQVASADALRWWDLVATDLEGQGYACTAVDLPAASVGAPHKRSRLFWVADATSEGHDRGRAGHTGDQPGAVERLERLRDAGLVADADGGDARTARLQRSGQHGLRTTDRRVDGPAGVTERADHADFMADASHDRCGGGWWPERDGAAAGQPHACWDEPDGCGDAGERVDDTFSAGLEGFAGDGDIRHESRWQRADTPRPVASASGPDHPWADCVWLPCTDGTARPVESGTFPLAHGVPARVGRLRGYGNAIVPYAAAEVLRAWQQVIIDRR